MLRMLARVWRCGPLSSRARFWLILAAVFALGAVVRLWGLSERSLWQDEVFTASSATGNRLFEASILPDRYPSDPPDPQSPRAYRNLAIAWRPWDAFVEGLAHNVQTPLYPLLMRGWMALFGADPVVARFFSAICGSLCVIAMAWLGRLAGGRRLALTAAAITAFSGFQVIYSQTARLYAFITLLVLVGGGLTLLLAQRRAAGASEKRPTWPIWAIWALTGAVGAYTHYFYTFALAAQTLWLALAGRSDRRFLTALGLSLGAIALSLGLWLPMLARQEAFLATIGHGTLSGLWKPLSLVERLWRLGGEIVSPKSLAALIAITLTLLGAAGGGLRQGGRLAWAIETWPRWLRFSLLWLGIVVLGLAMTDVASQTHRIFSSRYLALAAPALYLAIAGAILSLPRRWRLTAGLVIAALMAHNLWTTLSGETFLRKEDYRGAGLRIAQRAQPGDLALVCHSAVHAAGIAFYLPDDLAMAGVSRRDPGVEWSAPALDARLNRLLTRRDGVWLALSHCRPALARRLHDALMARGYSPGESARFSSMKIRRYARAKQSPAASCCPRPETSRAPRP